MTIVEAPYVPGNRELKVAALFFWGRSGTVFLHSLFDGHPEVLTFPATRLNAFHSRQWPDIVKAPTREEMVRRFVAWNPSCFDGRRDRWFEGLDELGPGRDTPLAVDEARFAERLLSRLAGAAEVTRRTFFLEAHYAYAEARGEDVSRKRVLLYHMHSPEAYEAVRAAREDFPEMVALGTVREPFRSLASYLRKNRDVARAWGQSDRDEYTKMVGAGGFNAVYRHQLVGWSELFDRWPMPRMVVRLEDLHDAPRETMQRLAAWLGIAWDEGLLASTWNGLAYWGDKMAAARQNGFRGAQARTSPQTDDVMGALDRYVLTGLASAFVEVHGYGPSPWHARALAPLLAHLPTKLERRALLEAPVPAARAIVARWGYTYRHLARKILPRSLRVRLPLPRPMGPGLRPPSAG